MLKKLLIVAVMLVATYFICRFILSDTVTEWGAELITKYYELD